MGQCCSKHTGNDTAIPTSAAAHVEESPKEPQPSSSNVLVVDSSENSSETSLPMMEKSSLSPKPPSPIQRRARREPSMNRPLRSSNVRRMFGQLKKFQRDIADASFDTSPDKFVTFNSYEYDELRPYEAEHWIDPKHLSVDALIPSASMITERGTFLGAADGTKSPVFLKRLNKNASSYTLSRSRRLLVAEVKLTSRLHHPHIVQFLGFTITQVTGLICISEFIDGPSLQRLLATPLQDLSWANAKMHYAVDLAAAVVYMHALSPQVLHGNLRSDHLYITQENLLKVAGFGFSMTDAATHKSLNEWNAPEVLQGLPMTQKVDVYAIGILLLEIDTRKLPFHEERKSMRFHDLLLRITTGTLRPALSPECPPQVREIIEACIQYPPTARPSADWVFDRLKLAQSELNAATPTPASSS
ncbi:Aste57867_1520 [Aphanomyces stellatus]|uniref:Aste57867_1520 protein n=1 Tax=Aphanomyces stellatus TaxID=120398 RepID=A0A485K5A4_9STRA|nr:hypothetical protein As57867_001519 [Aphanomyces stellatus]VFT78736.1 Aste57867_1520 [Aphanomyces stellatus]